MTLSGQAGFIKLNFDYAMKKFKLTKLKIKIIAIVLLYPTLVVGHNIYFDETTLFGMLALPSTIWFGLAIFIKCNAGALPPGAKPYEYVVEDDFDKALKSMKKNKGKDNKPKRKYQELGEQK